MTKAYRETAKGLVLKNGNRINYGQLFPRKETNMQRPLNSSSPMHPRDGAPKNTPTPATTSGMKRRTVGEPHPYLHGRTVDDLPNAPGKDHEKPTPLHPATTPKQRAVRRKIKSQ
jgi:hypothetical protein